MNDGGGKWWWSLFRRKPVLSLGFGLREGMSHVGLKAMSREKSVSRAMGKWKQRVKEVYRPCWLCLSSGSQWYEMVCVLEASDYFSMGLPEQQSSQDVAFSKSLGEKERVGGQKEWKLSVGCLQETHFTKLLFHEWQLNQLIVIKL